jgi:hypothetical protein
MIVSIENDELRVTVTEEGGHIAEILHKRTGINPLWVPPWSDFHGTGADSKLLAGIKGHNLCLDLFGVPSQEEEAAGIGVHGEGPVVRYDIESRDGALTMRAHLPMAYIRFERSIVLEKSVARIREAVTSECAFDRPIGWTQHVTLGPPFLRKGVTKFEMTATRSKVFEGTFGVNDYLVPGAEFDWPHAPRIGGGTADLGVMNGSPASSAFSTHLMNGESNRAWFAAHNPDSPYAFGYEWKPADFPWLGIWEENLSRTHAPWSGRTLARGMEFGVSPMPEMRKQMIDRRELFGVPAYRWLPAKGRLEVEYSAFFAWRSGQ